jgi:uncharacterized protein
MAELKTSASGNLTKKPNLANRIIDSESHRQSQTSLDKALFKAIENNSCEDVGNLLIKGANPNALDDRTNTPLMNAITPHIRDRMEMIGILVSYGADVNVLRVDGGFTALMMAGQIRDYEICKFLLEHGADPNAKKDEGTTALMMSTRNESVCELLLGYGAKANARNNDKSTALIDAAMRGDVRSCEVLIRRGAMIDARDEFGRTALMLAAYQGHSDACDFLLRHGADYALKNSYNGKTAYEMAKEQSKDERTTIILAVPIILSEFLGREHKRFIFLFGRCVSGGV